MPQPALWQKRNGLFTENNIQYTLQMADNFIPE